MKINATSSMSSYTSNYNTSDVIKGINNTLLKIEKEIFSDREIDKKRKDELNNEVFEYLNKVEKILNKDKNLDSTSKKELQILQIKFGMAAMKTGDADWESFGLSGEVFENNENFSKSNAFLLTVDEQRIQKITTEEREFHWNCCRYNFAYNIIYDGMSAPDYQRQEEFSRYFDEFNKDNIPENVAVAAANTKIAQKLCKSSFGIEEEAKNDPLFITIKTLNKFYDDYIACENPASDDQIKLDGMILANGMLVFLPEEIKENLGID
ncbi:hypothetical protein LOZ86_11300 [Pectobacterium parvum]|uniref:Uncharacterized protein n=2 Tax=Pectobacterium TaxID=122277 RepID=A0AAP9ILT0_9GAMM|nr:hypothetical protein [Pectobacterium parvum]QHQ25729.1 hypothetical protein GMX10_18055 [Pectobacterium parvum]UFK37587.1 hypothetical protein LOZ86_11300 [Pectobacterium parvum]